MGNFGKRILIILLSAIAFVTLALVGNAYQQSEKVHKVSNQNQVIFKGSYDNVNYELTKKDIWNSIIASDATDSIVEYLNMTLLKSVIEKQWSDTEIAKKKEFLIYGTNDQETIADIKDEEKQKAEETFENKIAVLGYTENGGEGHKIEDYVKYMLACDEYAKYRLLAGLSVGGTTIDLSEDALKERWEDGYKDTYAIALKFYCSDDASSFINQEKYNLCTVSSEIRYYTGNQQYKVESVNADFTAKLVEQDGENIPNANVLTDADGKYVYIGTLTDNSGETPVDKVINAWEYNDSDDKTVTILEWDSTLNVWKSKKVATLSTKKDDDGNEVYDDNGNTITITTVLSDEDANNSKSTVFTKKDYSKQTSFTTSNSISLTESEMLIYYVTMYNEYYAKLGKSANTTFDVATLTAALVAKEAELKELGYAVVEGSIRKYVGNEEYVVELDENGVAKSENGYPVFETQDDDKVPNYKLAEETVEEKTVYSTDKDDNFIYILDEFGEKISNKVDIKDATEFTTANTVEATVAQLYSLYVQLVSQDASLLYKYDETYEARSTFATEVFSTLTYGVSAGAYLKAASSVETSSSEDDAYYLIYKLSDSTQVEPTKENLNKVKEEKIQELLEDTTFVSACLAELRAEAGIVFYDKFFAMNYENTIVYNSSSNTYGAQEDDMENYYKKKGYNANKVAALTKAVTIDYTNAEENFSFNINVDKVKVTANDLYDFCMEYSGSSYITSAATSKILLEAMPEFVQLHGKNTNYLTSKNWLMEQYAEAAEYYNYQFEYYRQIYASYGYDYYDSIDEFLNGYGLRSFDGLVESLEKNTMKMILLYKAMVGSLDKVVLSEDDLTKYGKEVLTLSNYSSFEVRYLSMDVNHVLIYFDLDEDGQPDDYDTKDLANTFTHPTLSYDDYQKLLDELYDALTDYIDSKGSTLSTTTSALSSFVTEFNESSRVDGDYAKYKEVGLCLKNESFEVTGTGESDTTNSYYNIEDLDEGFQEALVKLQSRLVKVDNDLLGYSMTDGFCQTTFGEHFIVGNPCDSLEIPSFKFEDENNKYAAGVANTNDAISVSQIFAYVQQSFYSSIFGSTDNPEEKAEKCGYQNFNYPVLPAELTENISTIYSDLIATLTDSSNSYNSTYIILNSLCAQESEYKASLSELKEIYYDVLFGDLK